MSNQNSEESNASINFSSIGGKLSPVEKKFWKIWKRLYGILGVG